MFCQLFVFLFFLLYRCIKFTDLRVKILLCLKIFFYIIKLLDRLSNHIVLVKHVPQMVVERLELSEYNIKSLTVDYSGLVFGDWRVSCSVHLKDPSCRLWKTVDTLYPLQNPNYFVSSQLYFPGSGSTIFFILTKLFYIS